MSAPARGRRVDSRSRCAALGGEVSRCRPARAASRVGIARSGRQMRAGPPGGVARHRPKRVSTRERLRCGPDAGGPPGPGSFHTHTESDGDVRGRGGGHVPPRRRRRTTRDVVAPREPGSVGGPGGPPQPILIDFARLRPLRAPGGRLRARGARLRLRSCPRGRGGRGGGWRAPGRGISRLASPRRAPFGHLRGACERLRGRGRGQAGTGLPSSVR